MHLGLVWGLVSGFGIWGRVWRLSFFVFVFFVKRKEPHTPQQTGGDKQKTCTCTTQACASRKKAALNRSLETHQAITAADACKQVFSDSKCRASPRIQKKLSLSPFPALGVGILKPSSRQRLCQAGDCTPRSIRAPIAAGSASVKSMHWCTSIWRLCSAVGTWQCLE